MSLLADLKDQQAKRSKSAQKVAACVVRDPNTIISMSTATLAALAGVSEPTVNRFCTGIGFKGFPDFKLSLAAELARKQPRVAQNVEPDDSVALVAAKIFESTHASLGSAQEHLDIDALQEAVQAMHSARSIVLCGLGASASVALDAQHQLLRFPIPIMAHTDIINQRMLATGLNGDDCLICISYTGRTSAIVELASLARKNTDRVIGITSAQSPLAEVCNHVLGVDSGEDTETFTPMTSRIAQLVIIDILATCMALAQGEGFLDHLQRLKENLNNTRHKKGSLLS